MAWQTSPFQIVTKNGTKFCIMCGEEKSLEEFSPDLRQPSGKQAKCRKCVADFQRGRRSKEIVRNDNLKQLYKITIKEYEILYLAQDGKCKICNKHFEQLVIDHCHNTKKIRGLLCTNCNVGIGNLKHDVNILINAIVYLKS